MSIEPDQTAPGLYCLFPWKNLAWVKCTTIYAVDIRSRRYLRDKILFVLHSTQQFFVTLGWFPVFLGWTSTKQRIKCLAQVHNPVTTGCESSSIPSLTPRSHIHGSPRRFHYGSNPTDDPGNVWYECTAQVLLRMIMDAIWKYTD